MKTSLKLSPQHALLLLAITAAILAACAGGSSSPQDSPLTAGKRIFTQNCASCHSTQPGRVFVGPSLAGLASRAHTAVPGLDAPRYLTRSILSPADHLVEGFENLMPDTFQESLTEEELNTLVAYLLTL